MRLTFSTLPGKPGGGFAFLPAAILFAFFLFGKIMKYEQGTPRMIEISKMIQEGAAAFLRAEYKWLTVFVIVVALAIGLSSAEGGRGLSS